MISKEYGKCILSCDICGERTGEEYESFQDALDAREDFGWKIKRVEGEWLDICPDCIE